jgi:hypothetical protein
MIKKLRALTCMLFWGIPRCIITLIIFLISLIPLKILNIFCYYDVVDRIKNYIWRIGNYIWNGSDATDDEYMNKLLNNY